MNKLMMMCGHAANATTDDGKPSCVICAGDWRASVVDNNPPPLNNRLARCFYYSSKTRKCECGVCDKRDDGICKCERPSNTDLPFFAFTPDKPFDEFYCGCHSWD